MQTRYRLTRLLGVFAIGLSLGTATLAGSPADAVEIGGPAGPILVVAPHPDDDVITTAGITYGRDDVTIAFMTNSHSDPGGPSVRQAEGVAAQVLHLSRVEDDLIFLGYPDTGLAAAWANPSGTVNIDGYTATFAERGLGLTDWHNYRYQQGWAPEEHALYNRQAMLEDMVALIEYVQPAHIFTTSEFDSHTDHNTTYEVIEAALEQIVATDPSYGAVLHETIVWHPDASLHSLWPQARNPYQDIVHDVDLSASPSIASASGGDLVWSEREQFLIPAGWAAMGDSSPKAEAIDEHQAANGLNGFIGRFIHRDEIFWADYWNYPVVSISDSSATEGGIASFTVSRTGATNVAVSVTATTTNGSATAPGDFESKSTTVALGVGESSALFSVATTDDAVAEPDESFTVTLSSPTNHATIGDASGTGNITDNDSVGLSLDVLDGLVVSESGGSDEYRIALAAQPSASVTVSLTTDGQLTASPAQIVFSTSNWDTPQTVTIAATDDSVVESDPHIGTITHITSSSDSGYAGLAPVSQTAQIEENLTITGPTTAAAGSPVTFTADAGATSYAWTITRDGDTVTSGAETEITFTPSAGGTYTIELIAAAGAVPSGPHTATLQVFADLADSLFAGDVIWLADNGITKGCNPGEGNTKFCPNDNVTRGQMAAFLVRFLGLTDDGGGNTFIDDDGSIFEDAIAKLSAAGITKGCNPGEGNTKFCPNDNVTRGQMAAFLRRAANLS